MRKSIFIVAILGVMTSLPVTAVKDHHAVSASTSGNSDHLGECYSLRDKWRHIEMLRADSAKLQTRLDSLYSDLKKITEQKASSDRDAKKEIEKNIKDKKDQFKHISNQLKDSLKVYDMANDAFESEVGISWRKLAADRANYDKACNRLDSAADIVGKKLERIKTMSGVILRFFDGFSSLPKDGFYVENAIVPAASFVTVPDEIIKKYKNAYNVDLAVSQPLPGVAECSGLLEWQPKFSIESIDSVVSGAGVVADSLMLMDKSLSENCDNLEKKVANLIYFSGFIQNYDSVFFTTIVVPSMKLVRPEYRTKTQLLYDLVRTYPDDCKEIKKFLSKNCFNKKWISEANFYQGQMRTDHFNKMIKALESHDLFRRYIAYDEAEFMPLGKFLFQVRSELKSALSSGRNFDPVPLKKELDRLSPATSENNSGTSDSNNKKMGSDDEVIGGAVPHPQKK